MTDPLHEVREQLERVDELPLDDRPQLFERVHRTLVAELNALEEA